MKKKQTDPQAHEANATDPLSDASSQAATPDDDAVDGQGEAASLRQELDALNDKMLRAAADYQNLARRSELNVQVAREQTLMEVARALVSVLDHLDRALQVDPQATPATAIVEGVTMVRDELMRSLRQFGIERVDVQPGEAFDPNCHQALMRQASAEHDSNAIVQQFHPGYRLKDKTIRPAAVSVAE